MDDKFTPNFLIVLGCRRTGEGSGRRVPVIFSPDRALVKGFE